jgi:hypothetical protein
LGSASNSGFNSRTDILPKQGLQKSAKVTSPIDTRQELAKIAGNSFDFANVGKVISLLPGSQFFGTPHSWRTGRQICSAEFCKTESAADTSK